MKRKKSKLQPKEHSMHSALRGMKGEVFNMGGRVAGVIPPLGRPDAIPFVIKTVWPATSQFPAWADMIVGDNLRVRINPDICKPPFYRLFDCVAVVSKRTAQILAVEPGHMMSATFQGVRYVFWPEDIGGVQVLMIDTEERVLMWSPQSGTSKHRT
jgi:hypothetical protein